MAQAAAFQVKQIGGIPWILPNAIASGQGLSLAITDLAGSATVLQGITSGNFQLSWKNTTAQITTIATLNLFDTAPATRKSIRDSLDVFLIALDQLEATKTLSPGSARLAAQLTTQYLPLPLSEIPLYAFHLVNPLRYNFMQATQTFMDLSPGMRLNVCSGSLYQETIAKQPVPAYGGTGSLYMQVSSIPGSNLLSYEPFLDSMGVKVPLSNGSQLRIASGAVDFMATGEIQPYSRLFYPTPPGNLFTAVNVPDNNPSNNATIVRAETYENMLQYTNSFPYCCQAAGGRCALFSGRTQLVPEINVRLNEENLYVPVGTTLKHLVERSYASITRPKNLQFLRAINQDRANIIFENATIGFNMFLVPGDDISW